ncbi:3-dehydroquinate synthase [Austwickia chelonae]|uniref:3-dehydroquinate synthase n=1 Tax=Austwickia chelonae NBRC 105200 TaxID=1184607 RepID=K6V645_9MICO|nr:3-dehydroquinate synthase [Austwickia chelonae]GAB77703.1 3-dehydroquinate synthase [Austwickia chelonae NBRC 105200]SEW16143.1 3-dehydroquinate synthase [Austwickia chelonae]
MSEDSTCIRVGGSGGYDVLIGHRLTDRLPALLGDQTRRALVVHSAPLRQLAGPICRVLREQGTEVHEVAVPDAEQAKSAAVASSLWEMLGKAGFTRSDAVVTVGGGSVSDLGGFVSATWLRGVRVVHVPTTLLGMVDAAVGGKTGINTAEGKNLVGSFHPPSGVLVDLDHLESLPRPDLAAGMAEVLKGGFIADTRILELVEEDPKTVLDPSGPVLAELVRRKIQVKADVVTADLKESSLREILNYGHTFAHAVEQVENYRWRHGDAVAVGMVYAAELARLAGRLGAADVDRHRRVIGSLGLPTAYVSGRWAELHTAMSRDKKTRGATLRFVVLDGVGSPSRWEGPPEQALRAAYEAVI